MLTWRNTWRANPLMYDVYATIEPNTSEFMNETL
jgi:hypothetical protein